MASANFVLQHATSRQPVSLVNDMTLDLYLKAPTQAAMDTALLAAGLTEEGILASDVLIDTIGPITKWDYSVEPSVEKYYPEWHVNVRCGELTADQLAALSGFIVAPTNAPYRVWA